jgi:hypothetical protein
MAKVDRIGRVTSQSVLKCTGKDWDQWIKILDSAGARGWPHQEIVAFLKKKYKLGPWWQQGVTGGYEIHIGRRVEGQNLKGEYSTVATRTFPLDKKAMWKLLSSPKGLGVWLKPFSDFKLKPGSEFEVYGGVFGEVRTMKAGERARLTWQETDWAKPSIVHVLVVARPKGKCIFVIQHENLKDSGLREKMRAHWKRAMIELLAIAKT